MSAFLKLLFKTLRGNQLQGMASTEAIQRLESRALEAENLISVLKAEVTELQKAADFCEQNLNSVKFRQERMEAMKLENARLKREIEEWKIRLIETEKRIGIEPAMVNLPKRTSQSPDPKNTSDTKTANETEKKKKEKIKVPEGQQQQKKEDTKASAGKNTDDLPVDIRRLDIRVGKIINVKKHPDADSLYVEEVDLGEGSPRTVVSGLVKYVPIEQMQDKMVVALCNLKPAKMRGITSEAMVLCASTPEKVEVLIPPVGSCPGDKITVEGYSGVPDPVLNPKKKIFETVAPDLKTNNDRIATYKGVPFTVSGKGVVTSESLVDVQIK